MYSQADRKIILLGETFMPSVYMLEKKHTLITYWVLDYEPRYSVTDQYILCNTISVYIKCGLK